MRCNGYDGEEISPANDRVSAAGVRRVEFLITGVRCKRASGLSENGEGTGLRKEYREILNGGAEDGNDWERGKGGVRYTMLLFRWVICCQWVWGCYFSAAEGARFKQD